MPDKKDSSKETEGGVSSKEERPSEEISYNPNIIGGLSAVSMIPPFAPLAGFIGGAYMAWKSSSKYGDSLAKKALKTAAGALAGTFAGMISMAMPPVISAIPVSMAMSGTKATIDTLEDQKVGKIDDLGAVKRVGIAALIGSIPILGPIFATRLLDKESQNHQAAHTKKVEPTKAPTAPESPSGAHARHRGQQTTTPSPPHTPGQHTAKEQTRDTKKEGKARW